MVLYSRRDADGKALQIKVTPTARLLPLLLLLLAEAIECIDSLQSVEELSSGNRNSFFLVCLKHCP